MFTFYRVGGSVRDELLGLKPKDRDYTAVLNDSGSISAEDALLKLEQFLLSNGHSTVGVVEEFFVLKMREGKSGQVVDYVLARADGPSSDGRHPDYVKVGSLFDDLSRRDFTVNALARSPQGELIDFFNGTQDLDLKLIRFVGSAEARLREDGLRLLRALRFCVTKGFTLHGSVSAVFGSLSSSDVVFLLRNTHPNRINEELGRMFRHNTEHSMDILGDFKEIRKALFAESMWLCPTTRRK